MKFLILVFILISTVIFSQVNDVLQNITSGPKVIEKNTETLKSKSAKTVNPTIIKLKRKDFPSPITIKQLLKVIPDSCEVILSELTVKNDNQIFSSTNKGNTILMRIATNCKFICIDNLITTCPKAHNANYKIIFE